jgi:hypothetical protein
MAGILSVKFMKQENVWFKQSTDTTAVDEK